MAGARKIKRNDPRLARIRCFKAALAYFGETRQTWAKKQRFTVATLENVKLGFRTNVRVDQAIDGLINEFREAVAEEFAASKVAA